MEFVTAIIAGVATYYAINNHYKAQKAEMEAVQKQRQSENAVNEVKAITDRYQDLSYKIMRRQKRTLAEADQLRELNYELCKMYANVTGQSIDELQPVEIYKATEQVRMN